jgi:endonuclease YncB( thermonuclease family)
VEGRALEFGQEDVNCQQTFRADGVTQAERYLQNLCESPPDCPTCDKMLDVCLAQITSGMAWWFRRYAHEQSPEDQGRYEFVEHEANAKKVGLWRDKNRMPPEEYRRK